MDAIEIYQKIIEICKDQDFNDVDTAINFARNKLQSEFYSKQKADTGLYQGSLIGAGAALYNPYAEAEAIVRRTVRAEMEIANQDCKKAKEEVA